MASQSSNRPKLSAELLEVLDSVNQRKAARPSSNKSARGSVSSAKNLNDHSKIKANTLPSFIRMSCSPVSPTSVPHLSFPLYELESTVADDTPPLLHSNTVPSRRARLEELRTKMLGPDRLRSSNSGLISAPSRIFARSETVIPVKVRASPLELYLSSINDPFKDPREVIATIKFYELTREELKLWQDCSVDVSNVIDAFFTLLQDQSREASQAEESCPRYLICNTDIANAMLEKSDAVHSRNYVLRYDYAFYPIFKSHWSLLVVDIRERKVTYYDPTKRDEDLTDTLVSLFHFFKSEMAYHENRNIEETTWRDFTYKTPTAMPKFNTQDSAAFICKVAQQLLCGGQLNLEPRMASQYRREVLMTIVSHSLKI